MNRSIKQLIIFGDSGVYGWGDTLEGGWSERLRKNWMIKEEFPAIYTLGVRGDGLEKLAKRWKSEWQCRGELRRKLPDGILISIGINDTARIGRQDGRPQLSHEAFKYGLERMIFEMKKNTYVFVMGLSPVNEKVMPFADCLWYSNEACSKYEGQIEEICLELNVPFMPLHKKLYDYDNYLYLIESDGIHLNSKGHELIFKLISEWTSLYDWANS